MNNYINEKIYGLPKPLRKGHNTSPISKRVGKEYIHRWSDGVYSKYRVVLKRGNVYKTKYFSKLKEAKLYVEMLRNNKYL